VKRPVTPDGRRLTEDFDLAKAAIFDLDGTLLDSVDLHAIAWHEAMMKFRHDVSFEQARGEIGKGGDKLIPVFLTADEQRDHGKGRVARQSFQDGISAARASLFGGTRPAATRARCRT
jgi:beta-phosphoglucomutase-like phosphatase (HAD superfamily)